MQEYKHKKKALRILLYIIGMSMLALGLTLSTKADLGVSPIITVSFGTSQLSGINFGNTTLILYTFFIVIELILHLLPGKYVPNDKRRAVVLDLLQLPLSIAFTRLVNIFAAVISTPRSFPLRILLLLGSVLFVGCGAALSLNMRLIPNPGDGLVQTISDRSRLDLGLTKNIVDISCVMLTCIFTFLIAHRIIGVGIGTVVGMFCVGRVIAVFNKGFSARLQPLAEQ